VTVRTFQPRRGRVTARQARALDQLSGRWALPVDGTPLDLAGVFGASTPVVLEIGFGMGEATLQQAVADAHTGVLAVDVHTPGVGQLLDGVERLGLRQVRVMHGDALEVLRTMLAPMSLSGVRVFFPDPWPKTRHHKRRLFQPANVDLMVSRLRPGGFVHVATDWPDYGRQMLAVLESHPQLRNDHGGFAPRPAWRPITKFEQRGLALGHPVVDVIVTRTLTP
jgi:tRNA (guanine-N7-)-methyltransferase